jgi:hypothetical protein
MNESCSNSDIHVAYWCQYSSGPAPQTICLELVSDRRGTSAIVLLHRYSDLGAEQGPHLRDVHVECFCIVPG